MGVFGCLLPTGPGDGLLPAAGPYPDSTLVTMCFDSKDIWQRLQLRRRTRGFFWRMLRLSMTLVIERLNLIVEDGPVSNRMPNVDAGVDSRH